MLYYVVIIICTDLCPSLNKLEQVLPGLLESLLPLRDGGVVGVSHGDHLVGDTFRGGHALGTNCLSLAGELLETLP